MKNYFIREVIDRFIALVGLALTWPLFFVIAVLIKIDSKGPIFFKQMRVGYKRRIFDIYKFRSMAYDCDGPLCASEQDRRITRIGRMLRKTKLDELPQLINVIKGDMRLVGPRPEVPRFAACYPQQFKELMNRCKPGITDPVSLIFFEEGSLFDDYDGESCYTKIILPQKLKLYEQYSLKTNLMSDYFVIFRTLFLLFGFKKEAYLEKTGYFRG